MRRGFIKLWRKAEDWQWINHPRTFYVFFRMVLMANWKGKMWMGTFVERGSFIRSRKNLSQTLGISESQLRTVEKRLILTDELTIKSTNKYMVYVIVNYNKYQSEGAESTSNETNQSTIKSQTNSNQVATTKECKERKEGKEKEAASTDAATSISFYLTKTGKKLSGSLLESFTQFWEVFDYKKDKRNAADAWLNINPDETLIQTIIEAAKREAAARPSDGKHIWATNWLKNRRWEDEEISTENQSAQNTKKVSWTF
ncbi:hypothetical protein BVY03_05840 [bacterium K02(2017)]|nr:hypothetical protein BVY03_05840 [bacterium K02(2017)]